MLDRLTILVVGGGGREHALAWKLSQSPLAGRVLVAPGNGGTATEPARGAPIENVAVADDDIDGLVALAKERGVGLVAVGPEMPLTQGLADALQEAGVPCFGPVAAAARLEGSKRFAKEVMAEAGVPTAAYAAFTDHAEAVAHLQARPEGPLVVKADGLAAGKGVILCRNRAEARAALDDIMQKGAFGEAGATVILEETLVGEEASFMAFCDGENVVALPSSQDHKAVGEGDTGPNTGGMGAYSPAPVLPEAKAREMLDLVVRPIVAAMRKRGVPYKGVLYAGLMMTAEGPKVLEYNVRFGDPECQPLMLRFGGDLAETMLACSEGRLTEQHVCQSPQTAVCVVLASEGYPGAYAKGKAITGLEAAGDVDGVKVFHAGTALAPATPQTVGGPIGGGVETAGGRVLGVTALGADLAQARQRAYAACDAIDFEGKRLRRDIGAKGLNR